MALTQTRFDCTSPMQTVVVGSDPPRRFFLHHKILCKSSELFKSIPVSPEAIELRSSDPDAFELYSSWLYTGIAAVPQACYLSGTTQPSWLYLARAYALGEKVQDCKFKDLAVNCMRRLSTDFDGSMCDSLLAVTTIYKSTHSDSPARLLMVQLYARSSKSRQWLDSARYMYPYDFIFDLTQILASVRDGEPAPEVNKSPCAYHTHVIDFKDGHCPHDDANAGEPGKKHKNKKRRRVSADVGDGGLRDRTHCA